MWALVHRFKYLPKWTCAIRPPSYDYTEENTFNFVLPCLLEQMTDAVKPNMEDSNQLRNGGNPSSSTSRGSNSNSDLTSDDMVAFSSRLIAAARAVESRRQDRLFCDPFAEILVSTDVCWPSYPSHLDP